MREQGSVLRSTGPLRLLRPTTPPPLRVVAILVVTVTALLIGSAGFVARWSESHSEAGLGWADTREGLVAVQLEQGGPAEIAGILTGDRLLSMDGQSISSSLVARDRIWLAESGKSMQIVVLRDGHRITLALVPERAENDLRLFTYLFLVGLLFLVLSTTLVLRLPLGAVGVPYFFLGLVVFVLLVFSPSGRGNTLDWVLYWGDQVARLLLVPVFLQFALAFSRRRPGFLRRAVVPMLYMPAMALLGLDLWLVAADGVYHFADPVAALEARDRMVLGYLGLGLAIGIVVLAVSYLRTRQDRIRRPVKWLLWGSGLGLGPFVGLYLIPASLGLDVSPWGQISALPLVMLPLCFAFAVARYRLTDLELFFKRGVATVVLAGCLVAVYLGGDILFRLLVPAGAPGVAEVLALLLAAMLLPRLKAAITMAVDRLFYQDRYDHRRTLHEFGNELNRERRLEPLVAKLADRVARTLGVGPVTVLVPEGGGDVEVFRAACSAAGDVGGLELPGDSPLARSLERSGSLDLEDLRDPRADLAPAERFEAASLRYLVPLTVQGALVALLATGPRRDGGPLNSEDLNLLEAVARHAAVAVQGARLFGEMRQRAEEIERLKDFNEGILERSQVGILVLDEAGLVVGWNRSMGNLTGIAREESLGQPLDQVLDSRFASIVLRTVQGGGDAVMRLYQQPFLAGDADERLVNLGLSPLRTAEGGTHWVVTVDDVTEEAKKEEALAQQERLASIGLLASGVAHEVNTPLTGISSYAQMLLDGLPETDPHYDLLKKIESQSFRASDIANRLLNFSRLDSDSFEVLELNELVEETLSLFEPQMRKSRVFVYRELEEKLSPVKGNRGELQQVILNLLLNAQDSMGSEIHIRTTEERLGVRLDVKDNGEGIRPEILGRIYDPFFTTKAPGKGTGLGLSITYGIVQEHAGTISVDSKVGGGTCFSVFLPRARRDRVAAS